MAAEGNQNQKENSNSFGLPKATFKPIETTRSSNWLKITAIIAVIVLIIGAGVVYWLFKRSSSSYNDFISKNLKKQEEEQLAPVEPIEEDFADELLETTEQQAEGVIEDLRKEKFVQGTIQEIQGPQGIYYVIIASYIDRDLAMDHAKKLIKQHPYVALLSPAKGKHFYRLAIEQGETVKEAQDKALALKGDYGDLWVTKY
jgi:hypothetical protein